MTHMQARSWIRRNEFHLDAFFRIGLGTTISRLLRLDLVQNRETLVSIQEEVNETRACNLGFADICNFWQGSKDFFC